MTDWKLLLHEIAEQVQNSLKPILYTEQAKKIVGKGAGGDQTRYIDKLAEDTVIKILEENHVSCTLVSEEAGTKVIGDNPEGYIVLDSVDGTSNALRGIPFYCMSVAFSTSPNITGTTVGLVIDLANNETFYAEKGKGAYKNDKLITPSQVTEIDAAIIGIELGQLSNRQQLERVSPLILASKKLRHLGATALEVCYVASGQLDAFVDTRSLARSTDIAAAYIILRETLRVKTVCVLLHRDWLQQAACAAPGCPARKRW